MNTFQHHLLSNSRSSSTVSDSPHSIDPSLSENMTTSIAPECVALKEKYDTCFNAWYPKYLKGQTEDECAGLLKK